jgi:hypothetical protein
MEGTGIVAVIGGGGCCFWKENAADSFFDGQHTSCSLLNAMHQISDGFRCQLIGI